MIRMLLATLILSLSLLAPAFAVEPDEVMADPALEARARALSIELRCLVCQNQSIDGSSAPLARDLRILVRERLAAGDSDEQVISFIVDRYGEFVLLTPRLSAHTLILWGAPLLILLVGGGLVVRLLLRRGAGEGIQIEGEVEPYEDGHPLDEKEAAALNELLKQVAPELKQK
ncbi:MAG: cytochrome c-type biogenesis protein CcmH [Parvibaculaceae bacterium]|nr:cytochrome c-type biogenesis protein CcmH [Parvibaculaceae bacterium]